MQGVHREGIWFRVSQYCNMSANPGGVLLQLSFFPLFFFHCTLFTKSVVEDVIELAPVSAVRGEGSRRRRRKGVVGGLRSTESILFHQRACGTVCVSKQKRTCISNVSLILISTRLDSFAYVLQESRSHVPVSTKRPKLLLRASNYANACSPVKVV